MNIEVKKTLNALLAADNMSDFEFHLQQLSDTLQSLEIDELNKTVPSVVKTIEEVGRSVILNVVLRKPHHGIVQGKDATLYYLSTEIGNAGEYAPRWVLAKIECFLDAISAGVFQEVTDLSGVTAILDYCEEHFHVYEATGKGVVIVIPEMDIECISCGFYDPNTSVMVVNAECDQDMLLSMTYEAVANAMADDTVPEDAATVIPCIETMGRDEDRYGRYIDMLTAGLAHECPVKPDDWEASPELDQQSHEYIHRKLEALL